MRSRLAELQVLLEGVPLPAEKRELLAYVREQGGGDVATALERLPDRPFASIDDVAEELAATQPAGSDPEPEPPHEESDLPPGGDDYVEPNPVPGAVRHDAPASNPPQKAIEEQTARQKAQKQRQEELLDG